MTHLTRRRAKGETERIVDGVEPAPSAKIVELPVRQLSDADLVRAHQRGERNAFERLYRRHGPAVFRLAYRIVGNESAAEDALHDGLVQAFERLHQLARPEAFGGWFRTIVVNACRKQLARRRRGRVFRRQGEDDLILELESREADALTHASLRQAADAIRRLPADEQLCWILRHLEGYSLAECAEAADCSLATVKRRVARAEHALRHVRRRS